MIMKKFFIVNKDLIKKFSKKSNSIQIQIILEYLCIECIFDTFTFAKAQV